MKRDACSRHTATQQSAVPAVVSAIHASLQGIHWTRLHSFEHGQEVGAALHRMQGGESPGEFSETCLRHG